MNYKTTEQAQYIQKNIHRNTPKQTSDVFLFDFQKNYGVYAGFGPFTQKKLVELANITTETNAIIFIYCELSHFKEWRVARVTPDGFELVRFYGDNIGTYWRKLDIEAERKQSTSKYILIVQDYANRRTPRPKESIYNNLNTRIKKITKTNKWCKNYGGVSYIGDIEYLDSQNGKHQRIKGTFENTATDIGEVIDKSGYLKGLYIELLHERSKKRVAAIKKAEADKEDTTKQSQELEEKSEKLKAGIINALKRATLYSEVKELENILTKYKWFLYDLERHQEKIINKNYLTVEAIKQSIKNIEDQAKEISEKLTNIYLILEG